MAANETIMSTKFIAVTPTDEIAADSPSTKRMFEMFEPTTFPIARSASPLKLQLLMLQVQEVMFPLLQL